MTKKDIRSLSSFQIEEWVISNGEKKFRAQQIDHWLWKKGVKTFEEMKNLPNHLIEEMQKNFVINKVEVDKLQRSSDGTIKNLVTLHDGTQVESVLIPTEKRMTACVSSQVGCSLDCTFCATAQLKRMRNLTSDEIYDQVRIIDNQCREYYGMKLSNIVMMGMGEPLLNYPSVIEALDRITDNKNGLGFAPKRITISTSGIPKMIKKMADDGVKYNLALSLHSARQELRQEIMPFSNKFPIADLKEALEYYYSKIKKKVTYEYLVWNGVNDTPRDIEALIKFCKIIPCKVNIIEYNAIGDDKFKKPKEEVIKKYIDRLARNKITVTVRRSRGQDINAACGQLANKSENQ